MKYFLIAFLYIFLYTFLTIYLILERIVKVIFSIAIILWDFKFIKKRHSFWNKIHFALFSTYTLDFDMLEFNNLKDYYNLDYKIRFDYEKERN